MAERNQKLIESIIDALGDLLADHVTATARLTQHFQHHLIVDAGDVDVVAAYAQQLRLHVSSAECGQVLDYLGKLRSVAITIDHVETAVNELFGEDRFIEPEN